VKIVIPCAGESSRMAYVPKHLVKVKEVPLISHVIDMWDEPENSFVFVIKRSMTYLWEYFPENSSVAFQDEPKGLADAVLQAASCVDGKFIVALGDCLQHGSFEPPKDDFNLGVGVWSTRRLKELNKSYLVLESDGLVTKVIEKPRLCGRQPYSNCGMGTYFFDPRVFDYIRKSDAPLGGGDLTYVIQDMIDHGEKVVPVWFEGEYVNVGSPEDLKKAEELLS